MNNNFNFRCYAPYSCDPYTACITLNEVPTTDYKTPYYNLNPNQNGNCNTKVWYKMKYGYINQYTYSAEDDINYVTKRVYQYNGSKMNKLQEISKAQEIAKAQELVKNKK